MDGRCITDPSSSAYKLMLSTRIEDGQYKIGDYECIAMSRFYGKVGDKFRITLDTGHVFYAIMTDTKKEHELSRHAHPDGSLIEFIVDTDTLSNDVLLSGSLDCRHPGDVKIIERMK